MRSTWSFLGCSPPRSRSCAAVEALTAVAAAAAATAAEGQ